MITEWVSWSAVVVLALVHLVRLVQERRRGARMHVSPWLHVFQAFAATGLIFHATHEVRAEALLGAVGGVLLLSAFGSLGLHAWRRQRAHEARRHPSRRRPRHGARPLRPQAPSPAPTPHDACRRDGARHATAWSVSRSAP